MSRRNKKQRPQGANATLVLGGDPYRVRFDLNALIALEEETGASVWGDGESGGDLLALLESPKLSTVRLLLWAGLQHEYPDMTQKDAGALVGLGDLEQLIPLLTAAFGASLPEVDEAEAADEEVAEKND